MCTLFSWKQTNHLLCLMQKLHYRNITTRLETFEDTRTNVHTHTKHTHTHTFAYT